jgi:glyoxylase-like metal-dependent hydrolase (beta-lactamase superfamily II)
VGRPLVSAGDTDLAGVVVTGTVQHEAWRSRVLPPVERVRPSVWSIPVPIPDNPLRYVLCYALEHSDGVVLIDPGWPSSASYDALLAGLSRAGHGVQDVTGILVTHAHQDHYGLACRIREESGAWLAMNALDAATQVRTDDDLDAVVDRRLAWLRRCGAPDDVVQTHGGDRETIARFAVPAGPDRFVEDGDRIRVGPLSLQARWTPGHSRGHTVFLETNNGLLFAGDHLLPRITPSIATFAGTYDDALTDYLASLTDTAGLPVAEVLPGHEYRFSGVATRATAIIDHHERRLAEVLDRLHDLGPASVWTVSQHLTWSRPWDELGGFGLRASVGETLAHLNCLARRGQARTHSSDEVPLWSTDSRSVVTRSEHGRTH